MQINEENWDLVVIGGGINGVGIANDAAGRGLKVLLCEKGDLASATSSASSKLIHGGLRYLEHYEFKLVKKALAEREVLLKNAPHIMWPLRFYLPHRPHLRPAWMIRAGLFLYDHLSKRERLAGSKLVHFNRENSVLIPEITKGFEYSDGWVDDARLVVLNAMSAANKGATILTQTKCINATDAAEYWHLTLEDSNTKQKTNIQAKCVVNATGPWVEDLFLDALKENSPRKIRLVKGSHLIVPKIHEQEHAYILQNEDKRIVFVLPYEDDFSLIGTTDVEYKGDPGYARIDDNEINYLLKVTNEHFNTSLCKADIVHTYSGVRPLMDDENDNAQAVTRDYTLHLQEQEFSAPLLTVYGGKITTYRKLAQAAVDKLQPFFPKMSPCLTKEEALPGGNFTDHSELTRELAKAYPWLPQVLLRRFVRCYGTLSYKILESAENLDDLGICFSKHLYQKEIDYLIENEWARTLEDIIWRRTKLGLRLSAEQQKQIQSYIHDKVTE
ncbi:glycerol-3-phosphate dehydrogenase [Catenovulum agarivorans DS-2]|uniref:Glycerol-3-phosphate dehydrogenase n=1 Tax=Catenovulum agarivorans DS-2 TaxID=1328313 RepID=W7QY24_9ALTE|nr:glycerol-3-phosphate dehydrogenase [Catenovulum agarivorans]EWH10205.1 glycerol-3-phosphate dehydrogenase [Catenovulum agarivorans DS-2]